MKEQHLNIKFKFCTLSAYRNTPTHKPVGGCGPAKRSAFFSGSELQKAIPFLGVNLGSTVPGFVLNQVEASMVETFFPKHIKGNIVETSGYIGLWAALSELYAKGTANDAHLFLIKGETSYQSIFWNTELHNS
jgi:hypothetical protein